MTGQVTAQGPRGEVVLALPGPLTDDAGGRRSLALEVGRGCTVGDVLDRAAASFPLLGRRIRDEQGELRRFVNVYVGEEDVRCGMGLATPVRPGDTVYVLPSVAGG